jgi:hypothetical protein
LHPGGDERIGFYTAEVDIRVEGEGEVYKSSAFKLLMAGDISGFFLAPIEELLHKIFYDTREAHLTPYTAGVSNLDHYRQDAGVVYQPGAMMRSLGYEESGARTIEPLSLNDDRYAPLKHQRMLLDRTINVTLVESMLALPDITSANAIASDGTISDAILQRIKSTGKQVPLYGQQFVEDPSIFADSVLYLCNLLTAVDMRARAATRKNKKLSQYF